MQRLLLITHACNPIPLVEICDVQAVVSRATARPSWCPGVAPPKHLDGSLPGDYGFDPLNLAANPEALDWCVLQPSGLLCMAVAATESSSVQGCPFIQQNVNAVTLLETNGAVPQQYVRAGTDHRS